MTGSLVGCSGVTAGAGEAAQVAASNSGAQLATVQPTPAGDARDVRRGGQRRGAGLDRGDLLAGGRGGLGAARDDVAQQRLRLPGGERERVLVAVEVGLQAGQRQRVAERVALEVAGARLGAVDDRARAAIADAGGDGLATSTHVSSAPIAVSPLELSTTLLWAVPEFWPALPPKATSTVIVRVRRVGERVQPARVVAGLADLDRAADRDPAEHDRLRGGERLVAVVGEAEAAHQLAVEARRRVGRRDAGHADADAAEAVEGVVGDRADRARVELGRREVVDLPVQAVGRRDRGDGRAGTAAASTAVPASSAAKERFIGGFPPRI